MVPTCKNVAPYSRTSLNVGTMVNAPHTHTHTQHMHREISRKDRHMTAYSTCIYSEYLQKYNVPRNPQSREYLLVCDGKCCVYGTFATAQYAWARL